MGRSVSYRNGAEEVLYFVLPNVDELRQQRIEDAADFDEDPEEVREWPDEAFHDDIQLAFDEHVGNIQYELRQRFPSFEDAERWPEDEVQVFSENRLCEVSVAEYCGLVSVSIRAKNQCEYCWQPCDCDPTHNLATAWTRRNAERIAQTIREAAYLEELHKIGTFGNGESVYQLAR